MLIFIAFLIASVSAIIAYVIAGPIWVREHALRYQIGKTSGQVSGAIGEIALMAVAAVLLVLIDHVSDKSGVEQLISQKSITVLIGFVIVCVLIYVYGFYTALTAPPGEKTPLFFTYLVYNIYSIVFFAGGILLVAILIEQTFLDGKAFAAHADTILQTLSSEGLNSPRALELSFVDVQVLLGQVEQLMAPAFMFLGGIFAINIAIRFTPLYGLFRESARNITHATTAIGVLTVIGVGGWVYVQQYSELIDDYLVVLDQMRASGLSEDPLYIQRYGQIYLSLDDQKSLIGFFSRLANEWGGLAVILGFFQWAGRQVIGKRTTRSER